jgi:4a-hydroxytetrahydrobiopterin dehydratase
MTELAQRRCVPCEGGTAPLTRGAADELLLRLDPAWTLDEKASSLRREFSFRDFYRTMSFVNAVAHVANIEDHHPDLEVGYNVCRVRYSTHSIGGLSENDFICAAKLDQIPRL